MDWELVYTSTYYAEVLKGCPEESMPVTRMGLLSLDCQGCMATEQFRFDDQGNLWKLVK